MPKNMSVALEYYSDLSLSVISLCLKFLEWNTAQCHPHSSAHSRREWTDQIPCPTALPLLANWPLSQIPGVLEGRNGISQFLYAPSLWHRAGSQGLLLDEKEAFLTLADDKKSFSWEALAAHLYYLRLGKIFEFTNSLLRFYLGNSFQKGPPF